MSWKNSSLESILKEFYDKNKKYMKIILIKYK